MEDFKKTLERLSDKGYNFVQMSYRKYSGIEVREGNIIVLDTLGRDAEILPSRVPGLIQQSLFSGFSSEVIIPTEVDLLFHSDKNRYRSNYSKDASPPFKYLSILNLQREEVRFSEREWGLSYSHPYLELAECFRQGGWNVNLKVVGFTQV